MTGFSLLDKVLAGLMLVYVFGSIAANMMPQSWAIRGRLLAVLFDLRSLLGKANEGAQQAKAVAKQASSGELGTVVLSRPADISGLPPTVIDLKPEQGTQGNGEGASQSNGEQR